MLWLMATAEAEKVAEVDDPDLVIVADEAGHDVHDVGGVLVEDRWMQVLAHEVAGHLAHAAVDEPLVERLREPVHDRGRERLDDVHQLGPEQLLVVVGVELDGGREGDGRSPDLHGGRIGDGRGPERGIRREHLHHEHRQAGVAGAQLEPSLVHVLLGEDGLVGTDRELGPDAAERPAGLGGTHDVGH